MPNPTITVQISASDAAILPKLLRPEIGRLERVIAGMAHLDSDYTADLCRRLVQLRACLEAVEKGQRG